MSDPIFTHSEAQLVAELGLDRKAVRGLRAEELENGTDWKHTGGQVRYSPSGRDKLLALLKISPDSAPPLSPAAAAPAPETAPGGEKDLAPKNRAAEEPAAPESAGAAKPACGDALKPGDLRDLVLARKYPNKRIVGAVFNRQLQRVRVKDSTKMLPGLRLECRYVGEDLWQLAQRLPRFTGKQ